MTVSTAERLRAPVAAWEFGLPQVTSGLLVGLMEVPIAIAFATLLFGPAGPDGLSAGTAFLLAGVIASLLGSAFLSSIPGTIATLQDMPVAVLAGVTAGLATAAPGRELATITAVVVLTTLATGVVMGVLGAVRLGGLARYLPFPVLAGFLGGTGWLLFAGGLASATGVTLEPLDPATWTLGPRPTVVLVSAVVGVGLLVVARRAPSWVLATMILAATLAVQVALRLAGVDLDDGWLLAVDGGDRAIGLAVTLLPDADWGAILGELPSVASVVLLAPVALLLNLGAVELDARRDGDLDHDLRGAAATNLVVGAVGGAPGYASISVGRLARRIGGLHRSTAVVAAGGVLVALVAGDRFVRLLPVPVVVGVLLFVGADFLIDWAVDSRRRLTRAEHVLVLLIILTIAVAGFLPGVALGVGAAVLLFVVSYARGEAVRLSVDGSRFRSRTDRPETELELLRHHGGEFHVVELHGYVFFGSASRIVDLVRHRVVAADLPTLRHLVLDVGRVVGMDSSAMVSLSRARQLLSAHDATLVLSGVGPATRRLLETVEGDLVLADLDRAVQHCEDVLLDRHGRLDGPGSFSSVLVDELGEDVGLSVRAAMVEVHVPAGEAVVTAGDAADELFVLASGTCSVVAGAGGHVRLRTFLPGSLVGEIGMLLGVPRTATVVAEVDCELLRLGRTDLDALRRDHPRVSAGVHEMLARQLAQRLSDTTGMVEALLARPGED